MGKKRTAAAGVIGITGSVLLFLQFYMFFYTLLNITLNLGLYYPELEAALGFVWGWPLWVWAILDILFYVGLLVFVFRPLPDERGVDAGSD